MNQNGAKARSPNRGPSHADTNERSGMGTGCEGFPSVPLASRRQGTRRPQVLEALHYFTVHDVTWRALPAEFGNWNSVWKRFWRLSRAGVFEAFFDALASLSDSAHLVQMFDSTVVRAHVSAAGAKGGRRAKPSAARTVASRRKSISRPISTAVRSPSI